MSELWMVELGQEDGGLRIVGVPHDHVMMCCGAGRMYEHDLLDAIREGAWCKDGICLDIGSYIGTHALYLARVCEARMVLAYEPFEASFARLCMNVGLNGQWNVLPVQMAVSASERVLALGFTDQARLDPQHLNLASVEEKADGSPVRSGPVGVDQPVAFIKIDADDNTSDALAGCSSVIERDWPVVACEIEQNYADECRGRLEDWGYVLRSVHAATPVGIFVKS